MWQRQPCTGGAGGENDLGWLGCASTQARVIMCRVPALNKLGLSMMAMKMITNNGIEDNSAQRRQPCCGGGGGDNDGCWYACSFA